MARGIRSPGVTAAPSVHSIFDGPGETALIDARRLAWAGELATRAAPERDADSEALGAVFRAIHERLELVVRWIDTVREEVCAVEGT